MDAVLEAPTRRKIDVDAYYRMVEAGILAEDDRVELIDGDIIDMAPIGQEHAAVVNGLNQALVLACVGRAIVSPQNPVRIDIRNEPQPDFAVLRPRADFYATGERPGPLDTLLLVEVAWSSLAFDRTVKLPIYARAGIPEYWIVDLRRKLVEVYSKPAGDEYGTKTTHRAGERLALAAAPEIVVGLDIVFG
jgi:hypothetical protein